jgi:hypothetical protein
MIFSIVVFKFFLKFKFLRENRSKKAAREISQNNDNQDIKWVFYIMKFQLFFVNNITMGLNKTA